MRDGRDNTCEQHNCPGAINPGDDRKSSINVLATRSNRFRLVGDRKFGRRRLRDQGGLLSCACNELALACAPLASTWSAECAGRFCEQRTVARGSPVGDPASATASIWRAVSWLHVWRRAVPDADLQSVLIQLPEFGATPCIWNARSGLSPWSDRERFCTAAVSVLATGAARVAACPAVPESLSPANSATNVASEWTIRRSATEKSSPLDYRPDPPQRARLDCRHFPSPERRCIPSASA
jgi:hypothetical protein